MVCNYFKIYFLKKALYTLVKEFNVTSNMIKKVKYFIVLYRLLTHTIKKLTYLFSISSNLT